LRIDVSIPHLLAASNSYAEIGRIQGEQWGSGARELFAIRWELTRQRSRIDNDQQLIHLARAHLPVLRDFDAGLYQELVALSGVAELEPWQLVVLNHYTDFRDIAPDDGGCSVITVPTENGPLLGQTWDMHSTAMPYTAVLQVAPPDGPMAALFTVMGCLGMAGINEAGVSVCINNLTPNDARIGVLWPALVRKMLRRNSAEDALEVLQSAPLSSGHNYLIADAGGVFNVEATARQQRITHQTVTRPYFHTNHYLDADLAQCEMPLHPSSTSHLRFCRLQELMDPMPTTRDELWTLLSSHEGYPQSICSHLKGDEPSGSRTCGAVICEPHAARLTVHRGCLHEGKPLVLKLGLV
jgi:isopenicillin-N N-acyltransferase-like protein